MPLISAANSCCLQRINLFISNTGYRSGNAAENLAENGYKNVYKLEHGIKGWNLQNLPVVSKTDSHPATDNKMEPGFFAKLIQSDSLAFREFYAPWWCPCSKIMPMMDILNVEYYNPINFVKADADASKSLIKEMKLISVPYLVLYYKGELIFSKDGAIIREEIAGIVQAKIQKYPIQLK